MKRLLIAVLALLYPCVSSGQQTNIVSSPNTSANIVPGQEVFVAEFGPWQYQGYSYSTEYPGGRYIGTGVNAEKARIAAHDHLIRGDIAYNRAINLDDRPYDVIISTPYAPAVVGYYRGRHFPYYRYYPPYTPYWP